MPKIIHCCWLGGGEKDKLSAMCRRSWEKFAPDFEIREWDMRAGEASGIAVPPNVHEQFTRRILAGSGVELVRCSSDEWRQKAESIDAIFFDASHAYEDVKEECLWAKSRGIPLRATTTTTPTRASA